MLQERLPRILGGASIGLVLVLTGLARAAGPDDAAPPPVRAQELIRSTTAWDGGPLAWPEGTAEVRAVRITMAAGATTPWHCHPVPTFGYMLSGELEVRTEAGQTTTLRAGDAVIEVFRTWHTSRTLGGPVDLVAFYAGAANRPDTVLRADGGNCDPPEGDDK